MTRDIALGQFIPGKSLLHRLDPRIKLVLTVAFIVYIFVAQNFAGLVLLVVATFALMAVSGVPIKLYFKSMKGILFIVLFTAVLNLFYGTGPVLVQLGFMQITANGIRNAIFIAVRIVSLILFSSILT
ncbi:MAG: CbiQ family ECF transporter T component, partial [Oscillospiraceae bacterium]|nr:CbiQ family ECF transporter T component [Oscillospiraceae bacterium]